MKTTELAALRRRAREYGLTKKSSAGIKRLRALVSGQHGLREPPELKEAPIPCERVDETGARWVVALCRPSLARSVAEDLNQLGYRAYCPIGKRLFKHSRVRGSNSKRQRRVLEFAVFGRYLFIGELEEPLQASIHGGIVEVLSDFSGPLTVNPAVIRALNDAELAGQWDTSKVKAWEDVPFRRGDSVRIGQGSPLEGFLGIVEQITKAGVKVSVAQLFGRRTSVLVPGSNLVADAAE